MAELNQLFGAWLEGVYHRTLHTEIGETPLARRLAGRTLRRPSPAELHEAFLWAQPSTVSGRTATLVHPLRAQLDQEIPCAFTTPRSRSVSD